MPLISFRKKKLELDRKQLQRRLSNVTKLAKKALINCDAYLQGDAERKNINLAKYWAEIKANLTDDSDDDNYGQQQNAGNDEMYIFISEEINCSLQLEISRHISFRYLLI